MNAGSAGDHWLTCRHRLLLQFPLPLSLILFDSLRLYWICNDRVGCWIRDWGRQGFKLAEKRGSDTNAGCGAGYNSTQWVCLWSSTGHWCAMTACTRCGGWSIYWPLLCSGQGGSHALSIICNARIVLWRWQGRVVIFDCRGYGTLCVGGIPLASQYGSASLSRWTLTLSEKPMWLFILTSSKTSHIS